MTIEENAMKIGYLTAGDKVIINMEVLEAQKTFNVYSAAKKFMWEYVHLNYDEFTSILIMKGLVKPSEGDTPYRFIINHASTNIFATEALFMDFPNVLSALDSVMVGYVATWMNTDLYFKPLKKLFTDFEVGQVTVDDFRVEMEKYKNEFKELV